MLNIGISDWNWKLSCWLSSREEELEEERDILNQAIILYSITRSPFNA
jgi:hypothetical protein